MAERTELEALVYSISADVRGLVKASKQARDEVDKTAGFIDRRLGVLPKKLQREWREVGESIGTGLKRGSQLAGVALAGIIAYSIKAAASAAEIENAFDVAFGESAKSAREFSEVLADKVGRDSVEAREAMSRLQLVIKGTGVDAQQSAELVKMLTERAIDVGSLFNVDDAEAFASIISGLTGEAEPLKKFGVVLTEAAVKAELLRLGFKGNTQAASEAAKTIARANLILAKTAVAQGDAANTADSAANSARRMQAEFQAAARSLGEQLLPMAVKATGGITGVVKAFNDMPPAMQLASISILGFIAAGGPLAKLIGMLNLVRTTAIAAGIEIGAMAAAGSALLAVPAVVGAGAMGLIKADQYNKTVGAMGSASPEELAAAIKYAERNKKSYEALDGGRAIRNAGQANAEWARYNQQLADLVAEQQKRATQEAGARVEREQAIARTQDRSGQTALGLPADLRSPVAGAGGRAGSRKKRFTGQLPANILKVIADGRMTEETARTTWPDGDFPVDGAVIEELVTADVAGGYDATDIAANTRQVDQNPDLRAGPPAVGGHGAGVMSAEAWDQFEQQAAQSWEQGLNTALYDSEHLLEWAGQTLAQAMIKEAAAGLGAITRQLVQSMGGNVAGGIGAFITSLIPHFAAGTNSAPGGLALVGELGPEVVNLSRGAQVIPNHALRQAGSTARGGGGVVQYITVQAPRSILSTELIDRIDQMGHGAAVVGGAVGESGARSSVPSAMARQASMSLAGK